MGDTLGDRVYKLLFMGDTISVASNIDRRFYIHILENKYIAHDISDRELRLKCQSETHIVLTMSFGLSYAAVTKKNTSIERK